MGKESAIKDNPAFKILSTEEADILVVHVYVTGQGRITKRY